MKPVHQRAKERDQKERGKEVVKCLYCDVERKCEVKVLESREVPYRTRPVGWSN